MRKLLTALFLLPVVIPFSCTDNSSCSNQGKCLTTHCECFSEYTTYYEDPEIMLPKCNYEKKSSQTVLLLATFLSFGIHHVYCGHVFKGYLQLCFFLSSVAVIISGIFFLTQLNIKFTLEQLVQRCSIYIAFVLLLVFTLFFWYLFDIYIIMSGLYRDSNYIELAY